MLKDLSLESPAILRPVESHGAYGVEIPDTHGQKT